MSKPCSRIYIFFFNNSHAVLGGIKKLIMMDSSHDMVDMCRDVDVLTDRGIETSFVIGDEEFLPFKEK